MDNIESEKRNQQFMRQYVAMQRRLCGFVVSSVPNWTDIDDIMQEIVVVLWSKYDTFVPGTDFAAWSLKIARLQIMAYRQKKGMRQFKSETLEAIQDTAIEDMGKDDFRRDALRGCLGKLKEKEHKILQMRYEIGGSIKSVANEIGISVHTLYKLLGRLHAQLFECINRTIAQEEEV
ncbi:MAG: sigma-70 family RNA polymerase sigma factor [Phycisphaerae bacterium]|nr:sigma-70 family RNA polymerase sigma factor [Phycisphaerae bacterium]